MYKSIFYDRRSQFIHINDDKKGWVRFPYKKYAYRLCSTGTYRSMFGQKLEKITKVDPNEEGLFESDVPVETRILVDGYYESNESSKGHSIIYFDIETEVDKGLPNPQNALQRITAISLYSNNLKKYYALILDEHNKLSEFEYPNVEILRFDNEEDLLLEFLKIYKMCKPDILTGWNSDFFDIPFIYNRLGRLFGDNKAKELSPLGICYYNDFKKRMVIGGVSCLDYLIVYKKFSGEPAPNYRLDTIAKKVLGRGKIQYDGNLNDLLENDLKKFLEYSINDTELLVEMDAKLSFIQLSIDICHSAHVQYEDFGTSSKIMEGVLLCLLKNKGLVAPNKPAQKEDYDYEEDEEKFAGAYVKEPIPGLYEWVINADLNSLYPNTIRTLNISPETKKGKVLNWKEIIDVNEIGNLKSIKDESEIQLQIINTKEVVKLTKEKFLKLIKYKNFSVSGNGILYDQSKDGLLKQIINTWYSLRKEYKAKMKNAIENKNKEEESFWSRREQVQKILLNSLYGVLGLKSGRLFDLDNAEAVTLSAQLIIKNSSVLANNYFGKIKRNL